MILLNIVQRYTHKNHLSNAVHSPLVLYLDVMGRIDILFLHLIGVQIYIDMHNSGNQKYVHYHASEHPGDMKPISASALRDTITEKLFHDIYTHLDVQFYRLHNAKLANFCIFAQNCYLKKISGVDIDIDW